MISSLISFSSGDSIKVKPFYEVTLSTRNVWRGIDFGNYSPSAFGLFGLTYKKFEIGAYGITTLTGTNIGYGNTFNSYVALKFKHLSFYVEDYYFNGDYSNTPTKFDHWEKTHFLEGRIKCEKGKFYILGGYTIAGGKLYNVHDSVMNNTHGAYFELGYKSTHWIAAVGGITGPSALNFHDREGVTNITLKYRDKIKDMPVEIGVYYNPTFDNISPRSLPRYGYGKNAFNFSISLTLI